MEQYSILWSDRALNALKSIYDFAVVTNNVTYAKKLAKQLFELSNTLTVFLHEILSNHF
jgi:plasmid stabilization system protein ParE